MSVDFSLILFVLVVITGVIWGIDILFFAKKRTENSPSQEGELNEPIVVEYARFLFPVVLIVFVLRGFIAEPFRIPSGSMLPTLEIGDFILVSKFAYGVRLPVVNKKIISLSDPERGDVVVFRYPENPSIDYIKRVVGVPGDKIAYYNKLLYVNDKPQVQVEKGTYNVESYGKYAHMNENLNDIKHDILVNPFMQSSDFIVEVPAGHYFVMGDNRDNSRDSRAWGFVPDQNLVGRAFFIWMNWNGSNGPSLNRIGTVIK